MDIIRPPKSNMIWPFVLVTIGLLVYASIQYAMMERSTIMNNWADQRCGVFVMFASYWLKPDADPRTDSQFAAENFQFCLKEVSQNVMKIVMAPFTAVLGKQAGVTNVFMQVLNSIKTAIKRMYDEFLSFMDPFFKKFNAIANQIGIVTQKLKMAFQRLNAALLSIVFSGISVLKGINNTVKFVVKVVLIILAIMVALIILLFFVLFPFIPLIIVPVILAIVEAAPLIGNDAADEAAGDQGAFCFTGDTPILLADGTMKPMKDLVLGMKLANSGTVEGILTMEGDHTPLFVLQGIRVSGSHLVKNEQGSGWHSVAEDGRAEPIQDRVNHLYCLNTSNRLIPVVNEAGATVLFRDWEEIAEDDEEGQRGWDKLVASILGSMRSNPMQQDTFCLMDPRIHLPTPNGRKPLDSIQIGDQIELTYNRSTRVIGIVEGLVNGEATSDWLSGCIEKKYTPTGSIHHRVTTMPVSTDLIKGKHLITDSGLLVAYVNGSVLHLRDFTEVGIDRIHETYPFVARRLASI
jgi:hypothetical protein